MYADWTAIIVDADLVESAVKRAPMVKRTRTMSIPVSSTDPEHYFMGAPQSLTARLVPVADIVNSSQYGRIVRLKFALTLMCIFGSQCGFPSAAVRVVVVRQFANAKVQPR